MHQASGRNLGEAGLDPLVESLDRLDGPADLAGAWPSELWSLVAEAGATRWGLAKEWGGDGLDRVSLLRRFARVAEGSLTAAFILSQHDAGLRRLAAVAGDRPVARRWVEEVVAGRAFTTVGLSQLTTSKRHQDRALLVQPRSPGRFVVDGVIPWVTAACKADVLVAGALVEDGQQVLFALPTARSGLTVQPPFPLAAVQASCTAEVVCEGVELHQDEILVGPSPDVMATPGTAGTGGLETSALALGLALAALRAIEAVDRNDLLEPAAALRESWEKLRDDLFATALGESGAASPAQVRGQANALVLRMTQAYLTARKGTGFLLEEPAQRWARQALFFLVWSCPSPVASAAIRDLAGLCST